MKHRILVIEPDETRRREFANALSLCGFIVKTENNGRAGVQHFDQDPPDVLVTALFMEEVDGLEVTHLARSLVPATRLIVLGNQPATPTKTDYLEVARQIGADICLRNPSVAEVTAAVESLLVHFRQKVAE